MLPRSRQDCYLGTQRGKLIRTPLCFCEESPTAPSNSCFCLLLLTMKRTILSAFIAFALGASSVQAAINDPCSVNGTPGVCLSTTTCSAGGGLCPGPANFKCCLPGSSCTAPNVNTRTLDLIKLSEGFVASPEPDPIGLPTVGYGHLCQRTGCTEVPYSFPLTQAQAHALLISDLRTYQNCIARDIVDSVRLNDNQYGALVSWAFNVGCTNTASSTLIRRLNAGENPNTVAEQELPRWNMAGGQVLPGLVTRRAREVTLFKTASSVIAHPPPC
ncbi:lysozyme [Coprinopsis cinerea okayama7|uniref:Lysozyme n=1 Tax=Coprinopsis cinerea (strain Okayama-7 / 130 / ATCC MYA-4618 / FGSC 9003) TaxID=240176 RepID=A8PEQ1_COPC7|nr:lysozyme [Coprinopsis cinerea okayama7\|eukprot:XP_001840818.2 lysozyme [Coprinopsis cinerea okayama7\